MPSDGYLARPVVNSLPAWVFVSSAINLAGNPLFHSLVCSTIFRACGNCGMK